MFDDSVVIANLAYLYVDPYRDKLSFYDFVIKCGYISKLFIRASRSFVLLALSCNN